jgi:hypothetical protein
MIPRYVVDLTPLRAAGPVFFKEFAEFVCLMVS